MISTKEKIEEEALKDFNELALKKTGSSNSQSESHFLGIDRKIRKNGLELSIDKMTITADVSIENAERIFILCDAYNPRIYMRYSNAYTLVLQIYDSAFFIQYDKLKESINARPFRVEFNPNNVTQEAEEWLFDRVFSKLEEGSKKISRADFAFDFYEDLSAYRFVSRATKMNIHYGVKGDIETIYCGASASERQVRLYNKKRQLMDKFAISTSEEHYWRFEVQLRHKKVDDWRKMLHNVSLVENQFNDLEIKERAMVTYLVNNPDGFVELSKNVRTKYKKLIEEKTKTNLTAKMQATLNEVDQELSDMINHWCQGY